MEKKRGFVFATLAITLALALLSFVMLMGFLPLEVKNNAILGGPDWLQTWSYYVKPIASTSVVALTGLGLLTSLLVLLVSLIMGIFSMKKEKLITFARVLAILSFLLVACNYLLLTNAEIVRYVINAVMVDYEYYPTNNEIEYYVLFVKNILIVVLFFSLKALLIAPVMTLIMSLGGGKKNKASKKVNDQTQPVEEQQQVEDQPAEQPVEEQPQEEAAPVEEAPAEEKPAEKPEPKKKTNKK